MTQPRTKQVKFALPFLLGQGANSLSNVVLTLGLMYVLPIEEFGRVSASYASYLFAQGAVRSFMAETAVVAILHGQPATRFTGSQALRNISASSAVGAIVLAASLLVHAPTAISVVLAFGASFGTMHEIARTALNLDRRPGLGAYGDGLWCAATAMGAVIAVRLDDVSGLTIAGSWALGALIAALVSSNGLDRSVLGCKVTVGKRESFSYVLDFVAGPGSYQIAVLVALWSGGPGQAADLRVIQVLQAPFLLLLVASRSPFAGRLAAESDDEYGARSRRRACLEFFLLWLTLSAGWLAAVLLLGAMSGFSLTPSTRTASLAAAVLITMSAQTAVSMLARVEREAAYAGMVRAIHGASYLLVLLMSGSLNAMLATYSVVGIAAAMLLLAILGADSRRGGPDLLRASGLPMADRSSEHGEPDGHTNRKAHWRIPPARMMNLVVGAHRIEEGNLRSTTSPSTLRSAL